MASHQFAKGVEFSGIVVIVHCSQVVPLVESKRRTVGNTSGNIGNIVCRQPPDGSITVDVDLGLVLPIGWLHVLLETSI